MLSAHSVAVRLSLEVKKAEPAAGQGVMVALRPPADIADRLAVPDGSPADDLHVTLGYLGKATELPAGFEGRLRTELDGLNLVAEPALAGTLGGLAEFPPGEDGTPVWVPVDVPGLVDLRQRVVDACAAAGVPARSDHGYTPHLTLGYDITTTQVPATPVVFTDVWMVVAGEWTPFPLGGAQTKTAAPPNPGPADVPVDGKPVSPDEEQAPMEGDPDADPRAVSADGATGYFSDQWGEMTAWFFDDGATMVGYISTPQEVLRVDDIDEWAREVDEAGLEQADPNTPPAGGGTPPAQDEPIPGAGTGPAAGLDLANFEGGLFDFSDLEGKHLPGRHNQRRHGNRYGISAGKRVLRRAVNAAGPRRQPGGAPSTHTPKGSGDPLRRRPGPPPKKPPPRLEVTEDTDALLPFDPDRVNTLQDLWNMNTSDATVDELFRAKLRAKDPDLLDELDLLHGRKVEKALRERQQEEREKAYKRMLAKEKYRQEHGSGLEGSPMDLQELQDTFDNEVVPERRRVAAEATKEWFWSREALRRRDRGELDLPPDDDIFAGRLSEAFARNYLSEELQAHFNEVGSPVPFNAWAGIGKNAGGKRAAAVGGDTTWDAAPIRNKPRGRRR